MAGRRIVWRWTADNAGRNRDVHVLRGFDSRDLIDDLRFRDENDNDTEIEEGQITFHPLFKGALNGDTYENGDMRLHVNTKTGSVSVDPWEGDGPKKLKNNFLIEIRGVDPNWTTSNVEVVRVHVHLVVSNAWLTPPALTVRPSGASFPEVTSSRFTVHALFDTGITGDLTLNHGVRWKTLPPALESKNVRLSGYLVIDASDTPPVDVQIAAILPSSFGGATTPPATLRIRPAWDKDLDPPKAAIVPGSAHAGELWEGTVLPERVPNVVLIGDGFRGGPLGDRDAFDKIVNTIVHHFKTDQFTRPFDLLSTRMNFWKVFTPADSLGISVRSEVFSYDDGGRTLAEVVPVARKPPDHGKWVIENLIYVVGLPIPGDLFDANHEAKTPDDFRAEWGDLVDADLGNVYDELIEDAENPGRTTWTKLASGRGFIEQVDAFPGMAYGTPPAANSADNAQLDLHEDHGDIEALRAFFGTLAAEPAANGNVAATGSGKPIGDLWATKDPAYDFDNRTLVLVLSSMKGGRAANHGYITTSIESGDLPIPVKMIPGRADFQLDIDSVPDDVEADACRVATHELAHSFGLGDEYRDIPEDYTGAETDLESSANLQTEADAQVAAAGGAKTLSGDEIKWNWHRVQRAAVIADAILEAGDAFRVPLEIGQGLQFRKGDGVLLRLRAPGVNLKKRPKTLGDKTLGQELVITDPPDVTQLVNPDDVEAYKKGNLQYIQPAPGSSVTFADVKDFARGSILYVPTPSADSVPAGHPYARLVAWNIQEFITEKNQPLTRIPCAKVTDDASGETTQWPVPDGVKIRAVWAYKIVGLYAGGARYACGIYHPTGSCMMRNSHFEDSAFCAVCRYVLVEWIDPFRHFEIDRDLEEDYPQPLTIRTP